MGVHLVSKTGTSAERSVGVRILYFPRTQLHTAFGRGVSILSDLPTQSGSVGPDRRAGGLTPPRNHPPNLNPVRILAMQPGCKPGVLGQGRFETCDGDGFTPQAAPRDSLGSLTGGPSVNIPGLGSSEPSPTRRVRLVVWSLDSQSRGGGSIPPRGTGVRTLREGRPLMA